MGKEELIQEYEKLQIQYEQAKDTAARKESAKDVCEKNFNKAKLEMKEKFGVETIKEFEQKVKEQEQVISTAVNKVQDSLNTLNIS